MKNLFVILLVFVTQQLFSQAGGETIYTFLNAPTSPKQIALGGSVLTSQNDVSQLLWNPSSANSEVDGDLAVNYVNYIADISVGSMVYAKSIKPEYGTAFLGIQYFDYGTLDRTDASGPTVLGSFTAKDLAFSLGYGYRFQQVSFGLSLKYVSSKIDTFTSDAFLYDFGLTYFHPEKPFIAALTVRNSGKQATTFIDTREKVGKIVTISAEYTLEHVPLKFYGALDEVNNWDISASNPSKTKVGLNNEITLEKITKAENALRHLSIGAELWPEKKLNARIGYNHRRAKEFQLEEVRTGSGFSYGFGFNTKWVKFDYAFSKFQEGAKYSTFGLTIHI